MYQFFLWFQRTENLHQNSMLFSGEMQYRRVWGYYGGFSQLWEGTKKRSEKTDVFFAQRGPNGFRMCLFWSRLDAAAASAASSMLASKTHDEENVHASPVTFFFGAAGTPWEGEQSYQNIFALDCIPSLSTPSIPPAGLFSWVNSVTRPRLVTILAPRRTVISPFISLVYYRR